jgi:phenol/toluene 2-monooxygenase (NADH) P4/A4
VSVTAIGRYEFAPREAAGRFPAPLLYIGWDHHLMFPAPIALPLPPTTTFDDLMTKVLPAAYGLHPDFARIDWRTVQWFKGDQLFTPRPEGTLAEHGFQHKSVLRFRTPGLQGLRGSFG